MSNFISLQNLVLAMILGYTQKVPVIILPICYVNIGQKRNYEQDNGFGFYHGDSLHGPQN
jgi:hypothetical protein